VPVLAVLPYIHNLHIEAEDSISQSQKLQRDKQGEVLKVSVLAYPRASNHTDFDVLRMHPQTDCEFVRDANRYNGSDLIVLPGSKHVRGDLKWLRDNGWDKIIARHLRHGGKLIGICGGYQMLGRWVHDPDGIESAAGSSEGLGWLAQETTLQPDKTLRNVAGKLVSEGIEVTGYEIHAGATMSEEPGAALFQLHSLHADGECFEDGVISGDNQVLGTYLHGLFDAPGMLAHWLQWAGLERVEDFDYGLFREAQIERLADEVEPYLPVDLLLELLSGQAPA
jgi:adenosylcobyric acid synthase